MNIKLPKNAKEESVFTAEVDMTGITSDDVNWDSDDLEKAVKAECEKAGISADHIDVGCDNNGNATFATVSHF